MTLNQDRCREVVCLQQIQKYPLGGLGKDIFKKDSITILIILLKKGIKENGGLVKVIGKIKGDGFGIIKFRISEVLLHCKVSPVTIKSLH